MKRSVALLAGATLALGTGLTATHVSANADDQSAADAATAAFNDRMTEAGGVSSGPTDITEVPPEDLEEDDIGMECFNAAALGLDAGGRMEGETARSFSDDFTFASDEPESTDPAEMYVADEDTVSAAVITVDGDHGADIEELVDQLGSGESAQCLEDAFMADATASEGTDVAPSVPEYIVEITAESDLGVGDASALLTLRIASEAEDFSYEYTTAIYVARVDRTMAFVTIDTGAESVSDVDGQAELEALVDAL